MPDLEREKLERNFLGEIGKEDCPVCCGENHQGNFEYLDGWLLVVLEAYRVKKLRKSIAESQHDYFTASENSGSHIQISDLRQVAQT